MKNERIIRILQLLRQYAGIAIFNARRLFRNTAAGWILVALIPAIITVSLVNEYAVNVPLWDDWERGPFLEKVTSGTVTFSDFYAAHIQHRIVMQRALMVVLNFLWNGDLRVEMVSTVVFATVAALFAALLVRHSLGHNWASLGVAFLMACIILHPMQYQNFLWAIQNALLLPAAATLAGLWVILATRWSIRMRWTIALLCALISTHSFSHGLMAWPILLGALLLREDTDPWHQRLLWSGAWIVVAAGIIGFYFHDLENTSRPWHAYSFADSYEGPKKLAAVVAEPERAFRFLRILTGSFWARSFPGDAIANAGRIGTILLIWMGALLTALALWCRNPRIRRAALPWLLIGGFGLACSAAIVVGRMGILSHTRGISPRYISMSLYFSIGIIALTAILVMELGRLRNGKWRSSFRSVGSLFAGGAMMLIVQNAFIGADLMNSFHNARSQARAILAFIRFLPPDYPAHSLDGSRPFVEKQAEFLNAKGWIRPNLFSRADLGHFRLYSDGASSKHHVDHVEEIEGVLKVSGVASVPGTKRPADLVVLCDGREKPPRIVAFAESRLPWGIAMTQMDYEFDHHEKPVDNSGHYWFTSVPLASLPEGLREMEVWILDSKKWRGWRLKDRVAIPAAAENVR